MREIFDAHTHIYPDAIAEKATKALGKFYDFIPRSGGSLSEFLTESRGTRRGFLLLAVATNAHQVTSVNHFLAQSVSQARAEGFLAYGFAGLHQETPNMEQALDTAVREGLCGLKLHPDIQGADITDRRFYPAYAYLSAQGLPLCLHMGDDRPQYSFSAPAKLKQLLRDFPKLRVLAAHFGGYRQTEQAASLLYEEENVFFDTSSTLWYLPPEQVRALLRRINPERVLFGTDSPVMRIDQELALFDRLDLPSALAEKILYTNAGIFLENTPMAKIDFPQI